ncbi:MAG: hypothetical protein MI784_01645 [Cytophagales bacterium]|nr:hypothetical protein [Cytophagales bacterium]
MNSSDGIDQLFREKLADHKMAPGAGAWEQLEQQLTLRRRKKSVVLWYKVAAVFVLAVCTGILFFRTNRMSVPVKPLAFRQALPAVQVAHPEPEMLHLPKIEETAAAQKILPEAVNSASASVEKLSEVPPKEKPVLETVSVEASDVMPAAVPAIASLPLRPEVSKPVALHFNERHLLKQPKPEEIEVLITLVSSKTSMRSRRWSLNQVLSRQFTKLKNRFN